MLYAMLALGLNIAVGWAGLLDLGYIAFFGCGAYGYAIFSSTRAREATASGGAAPAGDRDRSRSCVVGAGIVGVLIGLVALRLEGDYLAIVTLFVGQAFVEIVNNVDPSTLGGVNGLFGLDPLHAFGSSRRSARSATTTLALVGVRGGGGGAAPARHLAHRPRLARAARRPARRRAR